MQRNILPNSSAWILPAGVNSPPHFNINTKDGSPGRSEKKTKAFIKNSVEMLFTVELFEIFQVSGLS